MATVTSTFASYDRSIPPPPSSSSSINPTGSKPNGTFFTAGADKGASRVGRCLDDTAILALKRQYANMDLFEQSILSSSDGEPSQLENILYPFQIYDQDPNDIDDDDIPYDEGDNYDYTVAIQERLKRANEELQHDETPAESRHPQRVQFHSLVRAVDIVQDPNEYEPDDPFTQSHAEPVAEESTASINSTHENTVPLNDTQPKEGLSLFDQIKAAQFHGILPTNDRWATTANPVHNDNTSNRDDDQSNKTNLNSQDTSNSSKKFMVVAVNDRIEMQDEDDYIATHHPASRTNENPSSITPTKPLFVPTPPTEPKPKQNSPHGTFIIRPKSSTDKKNQTESSNGLRPKSAGVSKSVERHFEQPYSGVDFKKLLREAAEKKRVALKAQRRKEEEAEEQRRKESAKAEESYKRWLKEKESERKRINEEKRLEQEEKSIHQAEQEKQLDELREKKYKEWLERKDLESTLADEFKKLKASEEGMTSGGSFSSINSNRTNNHRAFQKWLRQKYEQSLEEKRQVRLEIKRQRRRQRRSIKRHQLQQDLQLAKSFGYT